MLRLRLLLLLRRLLMHSRMHLLVRLLCAAATAAVCCYMLRLLTRLLLLLHATLAGAFAAAVTALRVLRVVFWSPLRWGRNPRGVSYTFGHDVIEEFLTRHDLDLICRAHQVRDSPLSDPQK